MGQKLIIYTDYKNLACNNFNYSRVLKWILILEYQGPDIELIKVKYHILADEISRFPLNGNQEATQKYNYKN